MNLRWIDPVELVEHELTQQEDEGRDVTVFRQRWRTALSANPPAGELREIADSLLNEIGSPGEFPTRVELVTRLPAPHGLVPPAVVPENRIAGGWFGRAAGCILGKPVEGMSRQVIRQILESNGTWPLADYITQKGIPEKLLQEHPWNRHGGSESLRENIVCVTEDDDMNYPMVNLAVLESFGRDFSTQQVATTWLGMLPVLTTFTAERVAYLNLLNGLVPPETATHRNPYREWIGAQIRGDIFGWISPGNPRVAATLACKDARLSHVRNGIYAEMFVAAMVAAACVIDNPRDVVEAGLRAIPSDSELARAISFALSLPDAESTWEKGVDRLYERFGRYHWVHAINNAALVAAAILYGKGDFEQSICNVVMGGWDTDSNGATVGSIVGTMIGQKRLPARWINPLNNKIRTSLKGFDNSAISALAERTCALASTSRQGNDALKN